MFQNKSSGSTTMFWYKIGSFSMASSALFFRERFSLIKVRVESVKPTVGEEFSEIKQAKDENRENERNSAPDLHSADDGQLRSKTSESTFGRE
jgi:hypothetical protein